MVKNVAVAIGIIVLVLASVEVIRLLQLRASVASYAKYWRQYPDQGTFIYVALGDSATQGIGASKPELGYVGLLAQHIQQATGKTMRIVNLSVSGAKIQDVLEKQVPQLAQYKPNLITVEVGTNDVTSYDAAKFQSQYDKLAAVLPPGSVVVNIPYFGGLIRANDKAVEASEFIAEAAHKYNLPLVDLQTETRAKNSIFNYAADGFHPSNRAYKIWEAAFWKTIEPLVSS